MTMMANRIWDWKDLEMPPGRRMATYNEYLAFKELVEEIQSRNMTVRSEANAKHGKREDQIHAINETDLEGQSVTSGRSFESKIASRGSPISSSRYMSEHFEDDDGTELEERSVTSRQSFEGSSACDEDKELSDEEFFDAHETSDMPS